MIETRERTHNFKLNVTFFILLEDEDTLNINIKRCIVSEYRGKTDVTRGPLRQLKE